MQDAHYAQERAECAGDPDEPDSDEDEERGKPQGSKRPPGAGSGGGGFTACVSQDGAGQVYGVKLSITTQSEESASRLANAFAAAVKAEQRRTGEGKACAPDSSPAASSRKRSRELAK